MHIGRSRHKARYRHKYSSQKAHSLPINLGRSSGKGYATFDFSQSHRKIQTQSCECKKCKSINKTNINEFILRLTVHK